MNIGNGISFIKSKTIPSEYRTHFYYKKIPVLPR